MFLESCDEGQGVETFKKMISKLTEGEERQCQAGRQGLPWVDWVLADL